MIAKRLGIPILVFKKLNVEFDTAQDAFVKRVEDYVTGRLRGSFTRTPDLLPKVAGKLREWRSKHRHSCGFRSGSVEHLTG